MDGVGRQDPSPASALTAGWGDPAIILRCGVVRPPKMIDPKVASGQDPEAVAGGVDGVDWLMEKRDGASRFTTANRLAYVEVSVAGGRDSSAVLVDLAPAVKKAIPVGIAD
ncbi:lipoprotein [Streptomyces zinciresistens K42]|uniref:Lipoprotein n=1 Tax=Streptomyces zinciresistens K42 TaxID=700597 RepID=G2GHN5_9ACTN|nr:lipoprotein [Streptomyces zinciresistens K42]